MDEQLGLGREVIVDDVVQHGDVDTSSCEIGDNKHLGRLVPELGHVDLTGRRVEGAVGVRTRDARLS